MQRSPLPQQPWKAAVSLRYAPFSTSRTAWEKEGQGNDELWATIFGLADNSPVDQELVAKLESELAVEKEIRDLGQLPPNLQDFLDTSSFQVGGRFPMSSS